MAKMEVAKIWLKLDDKSNVMLARVTPAEVAYLIKDRQGVCNGNPIDYFQLLGTIGRDANVEYNRLQQRFGSGQKEDGKTFYKIDSMYPNGANMPMTFGEVRGVDGKLGVTANNEGNDPKKGPSIEEAVPANFGLLDEEVITPVGEETTETVLA